MLLSARLKPSHPRSRSLMSAQTKDKRSIERDNRKRGRVLLITDEANPVQAEALQSIGLEVVGVSGGAAAMISLQRSRPHLVIASTAVNGVSGKELARMLAQTQDRIPLLLTG